MKSPGLADQVADFFAEPVQAEVIDFLNPGGSVPCVVLRPDGRALASDSGDETARVWDIPPDR
jgi:WD40 repeat protein